MNLPKTVMDAKTLPPRMRGVVSRKHLLARILDFHGNSGAVVVALAPAGYGKSLLMTQVFDAFEKQLSGVAWLSLDEDDNDIENFFLYLCTAFSQYSSSRFEAVLEDLADTNESFDPRKIIQVLISIVANLEGKYALFIDDYHVIHNRQVHDALQLLLKHSPNNLFLFLSSRSELPLRVAKLRACKQLLPIDVADLRFDKIESAELVKLTSGIDLSQSDIESFISQTDGWPAVMQLAALALQSDADVNRFLNSISVNQGVIADFMTEEVADLIPNNCTDFLMKVSICERICSGLCEVLTDDRDISLHFYELDDTKYLFQSVDRKGKWFVLNPLFRKYLLARFKNENFELFLKLQNKASVWFEAQGIIADAALHAIDGGNVNRAFELLEKQGMLLTTQGHIASLLNLVNKFPKEALEQSLELIVQLCWLLVISNKGLDAKRLLVELHRLIDETKSPQLSVLAEEKAIEATLLLFGEEHYACQKILTEWVNKAPQSPPHILAVLHTDQALLYFDEHRFEDVLAEYRFIMSFDNSDDTILSRAYMSSVRARVLMEQGCFSQAQACYENSLAWVKESVGSTSQIISLLKGQLGAVLYQQGDLDSAQELMGHGGDVLRSYGTSTLIIPTMVAHIRLLQGLGNNDRAFTDLRKFLGLAKNRKWMRLEALVVYELVRFYISLEEIDKARSLYEQWDEPLSGNSPLILQRREWIRLAKARLAIADKAYPQAVILLKELIDEFKSSSRIFRTIETLVLLSKCHILSGQSKRAMEVLGEALKLDDENSLIQVFRDEGTLVLEILEELLAELTQADKTASHLLWQQQIGKILGHKAVLGASLSSESKENYRVDFSLFNMIEPLTKKEQQTLEQLLGGLSNKEIAEKLHVSTSTVKTHLRTSYSKLGVTSRLQAVRRFKVLGLDDK